MAHLAERYGEVPVARGLATNGSILEIIVSPRGSWTAVLSSAAGRSCIAAVGNGWTRTAPLPADPA